MPSLYQQAYDMNPYPFEGGGYTPWNKAVNRWIYQHEAVMGAEREYDAVKPRFHAERAKALKELRAADSNSPSYWAVKKAFNHFDSGSLRFRLEIARKEVQKKMLARIETERYLEPQHSLAIVGSREWPDWRPVVELVESLPRETVVVTGGAKGVDTWAEQTAIDCKLTVIVYPAEWDRYGKIAGIHRNLYIVARADQIVAFHWQNSPGTANTIQLAQQWERPFSVYTDVETESHATNEIQG